MGYVAPLTTKQFIKEVYLVMDRSMGKSIKEEYNAGTPMTYTERHSNLAPSSMNVLEDFVVAKKLLYVLC